MTPLPSASPADPMGRRQFNWLALIFGLVALGAVVLAFNYRSETLRVRASLPRVSLPESDLRVLTSLWRDFLRSSRPILIVYSNSLFRRSTDERLDYLTPVDPSDLPGRPNASRPIDLSKLLGPGIEVIDHYTGIGEVMGVASLSRLFTQTNQAFRVKRSLLLAWDDVKTENIVILGSPHENYFLRKLPQHQTFIFQFDPSLRSLYIVNQRPQAGEQKIYAPKMDRSATRGGTTVSVIKDYALISLLRGLGEDNHLLILAGTTTFATQAAAEYVTNRTTVDEFLSDLKAENGAIPESFEAVLSVDVNDGVPVRTTYVTHHAVSH